MRELGLVVLFAAACTLIGCGATQKQIVAGGFAVAGDLVECAPEGYAATDQAIREGGASWVSAILEWVKCIPAVVRDIQRVGLVADASQLVRPPVSKKALKRAAAAARLYNALNPAR